VSSRGSRPCFFTSSTTVTPQSSRLWRAIRESRKVQAPTNGQDYVGARARHPADAGSFIERDLLMRQVKCPHCGRKTTDAELASYSDRCVNCRTIPTNPRYHEQEEVAEIPTVFPVMRQLVGQSCIYCQHVIESIYEGRFCDACGNPIHNNCLDSRSIPIEADRCQVCGGDLESSIAKEERAKSEAVKRNIEKAAVKAQLEAESNEIAKANMYRGARLLFLMIIGLGIKIIFPKLQDGRFTIDDSGLGPGLGAIAAGIGMLALSYILQRKRKQQ
jgi:hypothetical protein